MKKLLLSLLLITLFINDINAESYSGIHSISLSYNHEPSYAIKIPKTIDVSNELTTLTYYVKGDIYADQYLQVLFEQNTTLTNKIGETCNVYTSQDETHFSCANLSSSYLISSVTISHDILSPGEWYGQLKVYISLVGGI